MDTKFTTVDMLLDEASRQRPDAIALTDAPNRSEFFGGDPLRFTWSEVVTLVDGLCEQLSDLGVRRENKVGIQLPNVSELVITLLACQRLGAIAVPFPIQHRAHELRYGIGTAEITTFVTAVRPDRPTQIDDVAAVLDEFSDQRTIDLTVFGTDAGARSASLELQAGAGTSSDRPSFAPEDDVTICWTSGTTGTPKGVPRDHTMWLSAGLGQVEGAGLTSDDNILCPFPLVNMAGLGGMFFPWLHAQCHLVLHQPLDLTVFLGQIQSERVSYTVAPPALLNMLLRNDALLDSFDTSTIRSIASGSAPLDPWMVEGWQARGIEVINAFGSNEGASLMSTRAMVADPTDRARYFPRVGRADVDWPTHSAIETKLVDLATGDEILDAGRQGELRFRGPTVFNGYIGGDGSEFDEQGYFRTGDVFELAGDDDPPRFYRFIDRAKDIIIRGGMNISAAEIEAIVAEHPFITEAAAVAFPGGDLGERVGVFVVASEGEPTLDQVIALMREHGVASYKLPERLELIDALPRNPVGKVIKPELRARWA
jgi:acyl-CoA synthetase (AMP-forming)/AMP-acid ligase II